MLRHLVGTHYRNRPLTVTQPAGWRRGRTIEGAHDIPRVDMYQHILSGAWRWAEGDLPLPDSMAPRQRARSNLHQWPNLRVVLPCTTPPAVVPPLDCLPVDLAGTG